MSADEPIELPSRLWPLDASIVIKTPRPWGITASVLLQEAARKLASYHSPARCAATGQDRSGKEIAVNSLGRWLFGVPGFASHLRIAPAGDQLTVYFPADAPAIVRAFLLDLQQAVETP